MMQMTFDDITVLYLNVSITNVRGEITNLNTNRASTMMAHSVHFHCSLLSACVCVARPVEAAECVSAHTQN